MGDWVSAIPAYLAVAAVLIIPGVAVVAVGWGWRSPQRLLLAPAISVTISTFSRAVRLGIRL